MGLCKKTHWCKTLVDLYPTRLPCLSHFVVCCMISRFLCCTCTEVSCVEIIGQCGRLSQLSWLLGAL